MYIPRKIDIELQNWQKEKNRKPLLFRGARQVGKTKTITEFSKKFQVFIEINFEETPALKKIFQSDLSPDKICENISIILNKSILPGKTLLFLDEIQQCPNALVSLRYFYEKMPELHVIAAGSLMEFAFQEIATFGVGRIRSMFMYPLSFFEFLEGMNEHKLLEKVMESNPNKPLNDLIHSKLIDLVQKFIYLGGMPEVIKTYFESGDLNKCRQLLDDLIISFRTDFSKYKNRVPVSRLTEVFESAVLQSGKKFVYSKACIQANHKQIKEALQLLITAGLIIPVTHSSSNGIPLGAEANLRKQKMILFDTGIFMRLMNLDITDFLFSKNFNAINQGNVAEQFAGLELIKSESCYKIPALYFWHREAKNSNAEVDYVIQVSNKILPIEVKSGTKGEMQSMFLFLNEKKYNKGIRVSNENFATCNRIDVYPLYAIPKILLD